MKPLCVVIPSKTASNLVPCIAAVRQHEPEARIIVVDDGIVWTPQNMGDSSGWGDCRILPGRKPFVFARNVNIGIRAAGDADVVLLNDDALLESPGGFSLMQQAAEENPDVGLVGAVTDSTGAQAQFRRRIMCRGIFEEGAIESPQSGLRIVDHIAFVCVLIPARTRQKLAKVTADIVDLGAESFLTGGYLDERYVTYGWDDNDLIRQCKSISLQIAVHDGCFVNHSKLPSTFRGKGGPGGDIEPGRKIYMAKWPGFRQ